MLNENLFKINIHIGNIKCLLLQMLQFSFFLILLTPNKIYSILVGTLHILVNYVP
jgi:hypothetical protein